MTCRAMRLRFVPWAWERLEITLTHYRKSEEMNVIANPLYSDAFLAANMIIRKNRIVSITVFFGKIEISWLFYGF